MTGTIVEIVLMRVLLAADSFDVRYWFEGALSRSGRKYVVQWVANAIDAAASLESGTYDVAVVDANLGGSLGLDLIRDELLRGGRIPIVAMLGQSDDALEMTALGAGAAAVIVRGDESPGTIDRTVRGAIERARLSRTIRVSPTALASVDASTLLDRIDLARARSKRKRSGFAIAAVKWDVTSGIDAVQAMPTAALGALFERIYEVTGVDGAVRTSESEVIAVVEGLFEPRAAMHLGDRLIAAITAPIALGTATFVVAPRVGVAIFPEHAQESEDLLRLARAAIPTQREPTGRFKLHGGGDAVSINRAGDIRRLLPRAYERGELFLVYQPQVRITNGDIVGVEALIRWTSPELGVVSPVEFIPVVEELGLIVDMGARIMCEACLQARRWLDDGARIRVGVNVSARQFTDGTLDSVVRGALATSGIDASMLEIEITEGVLLENTTDARAVLDDLRASGVLVAVDDFGTGYSSLSYVKRLPMDVIKIDREFVRGLPLDQLNCAISSAIVALARSLQLEVIAEGVENESEEEFLRSLGCDIVQGYLHAKPMTVEDFDKWRKGRRISMVEARRSLLPQRGRTSAK